MSPAQGVEFPAIERHAYSGKGVAAALLSQFYHVMDAAGICATSWDLGLGLQAIQAELAAVTGWEYSIEELLKSEKGYGVAGRPSMCVRGLRRVISSCRQG